MVPAVWLGKNRDGLVELVEKEMTSCHVLSPRRIPPSFLGLTLHL